MTRHTLIAAATMVSVGAALTRADQPSRPKPDPELTKLMHEYEQAVSDWAKSAADRGKQANGRPQARPAPPLDAYGPKFRAFVAEHAGTPLAIDGIRCLLNATNQFHTQGKMNSDAIWAIETLSRDYATFPEVIDTLDDANPGTQQIPRSLGIRFLTTVIDSSKDAEAVAMAKLLLGHILWKPDRDSQAKHDTPENRAAGIALIREVAEKHPDTRAGKSAARDVIEIDGLQVGMPSPDFEATDVNGRAIRFSELRGRVVVLLFWGAFASAEGDRIPIPSDLVTSYAGQPVTFLGVSSDTDAEKTRATLKNEGVDWPNIVDGANGGKIAAQWNVRGWPTIHIIDGQGAIRYRKVAPNEIKKIVDTLLAEK